MSHNILSPEIDDNRLPIPGIYNPHDNNIIRDLALASAIDIGYYMREGENRGNSFSKLSKVLHGTLEPRKFLEGKRPIDSYGTMKILMDTLHRHEDSEIKKGNETTYKIKREITQTYDLAKELVPIIHQLSKDLASFTTLSKAEQEILKALTLDFNTELGRYHHSFRHGLVA